MDPMDRIYKVVLPIINIFVFCVLMTHSIISISMGGMPIINIIIGIANLIIGIINFKGINKKR